MKTYKKGEVERGEYTGLKEIPDVVIISNEAENVGPYAFAHSGVRKVVLDVPIVKEGAFYNCTSLEEVIFSDNVLKIEKSAFYECTALTKVNMSKNLVSIGEKAFYGCRKIESLEFHEKLQKIGKKAFSECESLNFVKINENLQLIDSYAFSYCTNLYEVNFSGGNLILKGQCKNDEISIGENAKEFIEIAECPFYNCNKAKILNVHAYKYDAAKKSYKKTFVKLFDIFMKQESIIAKIAEWMLS